MKKNISLLLAVVMTASVFVGISIAANRSKDVNNDGSADNKDVVVLFRYVSGGSGNDPVYDYNDDGNVDNKDVVALFRALSSGEPTVTPGSEDTAAAETGEEITDITPEEGSTVSLLNDVMTAWSENYKRGQLDDVFDYTERCEPVPVHFSWGGGAEYTHLLLSLRPDMSDPVIYLCNSNALDVEDLLPGTQYYWQTAETKGGRTEKSSVHSFRTLQTVRTVCIPGVSNVRDIGGKMTSDGKRVKYGMVFRGADFAHLTEEGKAKAVDVLGIKTELDLREAVTNGRSSLGKDVKYISVTGPYYERISWEEYKDDLLTELRAFADPDNYPIYFHCSLGRDRTGTLSYILLALLGVGDNDLYMDYEASFFSDMGGYIDTSSPSAMLRQLYVLKTELDPTAKNLTKSTRAYLKKLGMADAELDAIRNNLLEDAE